MIGNDLKFFSSNKLLKNLWVLISIEEHKDISQHKLAKKIGVSSSMINNYMAEFLTQGLVNMTGNTNRSMNYELTPLGIRQKKQLMNAYIDEIACLYSAVKSEFQRHLNRFYKRGLKRAVFFGADETCEVVFNAAQKTPVEVVGIVDNDPKKHGRRFGGLQVRSPEFIESFSPDGVVITAMGHPDEIYRQIKHLKKNGIVVVRF